MPSPSQAISATPTNDVAFPANDIAGKEVVDTLPDLDNLTYKFVPNRHRHRDGLLCPLVPLVDVNVGTADSGVSHAHQHIVDANGGLVNLFQPQSPLSPAFN
jgi:hypothetical protein